MDTTGEAAAVVIAAAATFTLALLLWAVVSLARASRALRSAAAELREEAIPAVIAARRTIAAADRDLERMEGLLGASEALSHTVESASRLAYDTFSTPVIKAMAVAAGTGKAAKRMRHGAGKRRAG